MAKDQCNTNRCSAELCLVAMHHIPSSDQCCLLLVRVRQASALTAWSGKAAGVAAGQAAFMARAAANSAAAKGILEAAASTAAAS